MKIPRGALKSRLYAIDPMRYTPRQAAKLCGTTIATIYSLTVRYNINLRKAAWGEYKRKAKIDIPPAG